MRKIETYGNIQSGKLKITKREQFYSAIALWDDCRVKLIVQKHYKQRSTPQNDYYHGVIVSEWQALLLQEWGEAKSHEQVHEFLKMNFLFTEKLDESTGEILRMPRSTTELTTVEMEEYNEVCRQKALEYFNAVIPLPNEQLKAFEQ